MFAFNLLLSYLVAMVAILRLETLLHVLCLACDKPLTVMTLPVAPFGLAGGNMVGYPLKTGLSSLARTIIPVHQNHI